MLGSHATNYTTIDATSHPLARQDDLPPPSFAFVEATVT
jgi:hypothetical protein